MAQGPRIGRYRIWLLRGAAAAVPLLGLATLEIVLGVVGYGPNVDLFVPDDRPGFMMTNPEVARRYFARIDRIPQPPDDVIHEAKPSNGYRVFMMGGSTTAGWPYPPNITPSTILEHRLGEAFPNREIEVVNVGIAAVNSFTLLDLSDEILEWNPDAVLIYAGHNEYYGALGSASVESVGSARWVVNAYLRLMNFRTVRLIRDLLVGTAEGGDSRPTLMSRVVGDNVPYRGPAYERGRENFRKNLGDVVARFADADVPVLLSELVSNTRDFPPFVSELEGEGPDAGDAFAEAQALEASGRIAEARDAYTRAKDLDPLRFRAPEEFNDIVHEIGERYGAAVVPMKAVFESRSPAGLLGDTLFLEHLHPNARGYFLMADAFFQAMRNAGFIGGEWNGVRPTNQFEQSWPVTDLDREIGRLIAMDLMDYWPFRPAGDPGNRFRTFEPATPAEELAYLVVREEMTFVEAHERLANMYTQTGEVTLARRERDAIQAASPYFIP